MDEFFKTPLAQGVASACALAMLGVVVFLVTRFIPQLIRDSRADANNARKEFLISLGERDTKFVQVIERDGKIMTEAMSGVRLEVRTLSQLIQQMSLKR